MVFTYLVSLIGYSRLRVAALGAKTLGAKTIRLQPSV
jgi:hypothetical protein